MTFEQYLAEWNKNRKVKFDYSSTFIEQFINSGYELFLFHSFKEEQYHQEHTKEILKKHGDYKVMQKFSQLQLQIDAYCEFLPFVTFFSYEPRKDFYISNKICEYASIYEIIPNIYENDSSINYVAGFSEDNKKWFMHLLHNILYHGNLYGIGIIGYTIYNSQIYYIYKNCKHDDTHLLHFDGFHGFCGNIFRTDNDPYKIFSARNAIDEIMSIEAFENEIHLRHNLLHSIIMPLQMQFNKYESLSRMDDNHLFSKLREDIYNELVKNNEVPHKWKNEANLYQLVSKYFNDSIFQYYAAWITPQVYDIYIPSIKTAIEYQGQQHYKPIVFFGGIDGFEKRQKLDMRKRQLSIENGVRLIEWGYDEPITKKILFDKLSLDTLS